MKIFVFAEGDVSVCSRLSSSAARLMLMDGRSAARSQSCLSRDASLLAQPCTGAPVCRHPPHPPHAPLPAAPRPQTPPDLSPKERRQAPPLQHARTHGEVITTPPVM